MAEKLCLRVNDFQDNIIHQYMYKTGSNAQAQPKTSIMSADLQELDETVKSMMETSQNMIQEGNRQKRAKICKPCGIEGPSTNKSNTLHYSLRPIESGY